MTPIETELGVLRGRDCVYLDAVEQDGDGNMAFTGEINGKLAAGTGWVPYRLVFQGVAACFFCELDTYENLAGAGCFDGSCFDRVEDSAWLETLPLRADFDKRRHAHYRLLTYDGVYHVIAAGHRLELRNV